MSIQTRLTGILAIVSVGVVVAAGLFTSYSLDSYFQSRLVSDLTTQARQIEYLLLTSPYQDSSAYHNLQQFTAISEVRLTIIDGNGKVVFDSDFNQNELSSIERHDNSPEVVTALQKGTGTDTRHNATLNKDLLYVAKRINTVSSRRTMFPGAVIVRLAVPLTNVQHIKEEIHNQLITASVVISLAVIVIAFFISKRLSQPIKEMATIAAQIRAGNLDRRITIRSRDELGTLAENLNGMVSKLNDDISKLKKLEHIRSEFLGNVSHELRTPIFSIQGMLETLLHGALDDKEVNRSFVESALRNTERLNTLLADLIEISSIESGEMKMSFRYFALQPFLSGLVAEMQSNASRKNIAITLQEISSEVEVLGDKERLQQVMVNLIDNAIKYSNTGGSVEISTAHSDGVVTINVADTGVGIPQESLSRIFERFYRVDKERSREAGGTGLGLAIVKHIVEAHGGKVTVESLVGKGSTFSFSLKSS